MNTTLYVVVDIGCLECGEPSALVGIFDNRIDANLALGRAEDGLVPRYTGQHRVQLFETTLDALNVGIIPDHSINYED